MMLTVLVGGRTALATQIAGALHIGIMSSQVELVGYVLVPALLGMAAVRRATTAREFAAGAVAVAAGAVGVILSFVLVNRAADPLGVAQLLAGALVSGLGSGLLAFAGTAILGHVFGISTVFVLRELGDPNRLLLRQLLLRAPTARRPGSSCSPTARKRRSARCPRRIRKRSARWSTASSTSASPTDSSTSATSRSVTSSASRTPSASSSSACTTSASRTQRTASPASSPPRAAKPDAHRHRRRGALRARSDPPSDPPRGPTVPAAARCRSAGCIHLRHGHACLEQAVSPYRSDDRRALLR